MVQNGYERAYRPIDEIGQPLAALPEDDRRFIDELVRATLDKPEVLARVRARFNDEERP